MISRLLNDQSIHRRRRARGPVGRAAGRRGAFGRRGGSVLERQGRRLASVRRADARKLAGRLLAGFRILALTGAVAALVSGLVLIGRAPGAAEALGASVVPADMQQAAMVFPAPESGEAGEVEFERTEDVEYVVQQGETLSGIARRFELSYGALATYNSLADPHTLAPGQRLLIPREDAISDAGATWTPAL